MPTITALPASITQSPAPSPHGIAGGFLDINPDAMSGAAHRLRGLAAGGPEALPVTPGLMGPDALATEAVAAAVPGVGRFLAAVGTATATHSTRITELAAYAGSAALALDWMAGAVTGTDGASSAALDGMMPA